MDTTQSFLSLSAYRLYLAGLFLLPVAVIPVAAIPFIPFKMALAAGFVGGATILALAAALWRGAVSIPFSSIVISFWGVVGAYLISTLFSASPLTSLIGAELSTDTVFFMALLGLTLTLPLYIFESRSDYLRAFFVLLASSAAVALFHILRLLAGPEFLSFGLYDGALFSLLGKWNDLGLFFGLMAGVGLITLEALPLSNMLRAVVGVSLAVSLFFVALIGFTPVWMSLGVLAFAVVLYRSVLGRGGPRFSVASLIVLVLAVVCVLFSTGITGALSNAFGTSQIEARPSGGSTLAVISAVLGQSPIVGSGPNTFLYGWDKYRPQVLNETLFWNADFSSGVGLIPTSLATAGLLAGAAWLVFLILFLIAGIRGLALGTAADPYTHYLMAVSYAAGLYVLVLSVIYLPSPVILIIGFAAIGMYAALYHREQGGRTIHLVFAERPRLGFLAVLTLTAKLVAFVLLMAGVAVGFLSAVKYQQALVSLQSEDGRPAAAASIAEGLALMPHERLHRLGVAVDLAELSAVVNAATEENAAESQTAFQQHLGSAVEHGLAATRSDPRDYRNWLSLGSAYHRVVPLGITGAYESAVAAYESADTLNPKTPIIPQAQAELAIAHQEPEKARPYLESAISRKADYVPALLLLAQLELSSGNLDQAIRRAEAASVFEPNNAVLQFQVGVLKFEKEDYAGAKTAFTRALEIAPDYANAQYYRGRTLFAEGDTAGALAAFREVARLNPDNAEVAGVLADIEAGTDPFVAGTDEDENE